MIRVFDTIANGLRGIFYWVDGGSYEMDGLSDTQKMGFLDFRFL